jgi:hypothetical protein
MADLINDREELLIDSSSILYPQVRKYSKKNKIFKFLGTNKRHHFIEKKYDYSWNISKINANLTKSHYYYIEGYFQDPAYFSNIDPAYHFRGLISKISHNEDFFQLISNSNSVSIHVRRGDYLNESSPFQIMGLDYYKNAIELIEKIDNSELKYFVFSDDLNWCRENLWELNRELVYVDINKGLNSISDIYLMSSCNHNIISASSFSWWGAFFNPNPCKTVVAPLFFYKNFSRSIENYGLKLPEWKYL